MKKLILIPVLVLAMFTLTAKPAGATFNLPKCAEGTHGIWPICIPNSPQPSPSPTVSPTPTSSPEETWYPTATPEATPVESSEPTATPEVVETPRPEVPLTPAGAPSCDGVSFVLKPGNVLVKRHGASATVQWQPSQGSEAHIYYYQNENPLNAHAVRDTQNDGIEEINLLGSLNWTLGVQQKDGCSASEVVWVVDDNGVKLFRALPYNVN